MSDVVICLFAGSEFDRAASGLAGAGQRLAAELGGRLLAILIGPANQATIDSLASCADQVLHAEHPELAEYQPETYLSVLEQLCRGVGPGAILLGSDTYSQELAPRLASRLGGSSLADAGALAVVDSRLRVTRAAYGGKAQAVYEMKRDPAVICLRARAFEPATGTTAATVTSPEFAVPEKPPTYISERHAEASEGIALEDAQLIVAGGRGLGGEEGFAELKKLAAVMGAAVGSSRVACDEGWVPPSWQIGQTGKKVAPEFYLAVAISGAAQHLLGMADSGVIAAINNDSEAPIFRHCSFGIVEDYRKVVPELTARLAELAK